MKLTRRQYVEMLRLRRIRARKQTGFRSLARQAEHPLVTREGGGSMPARPTK